MCYPICDCRQKSAGMGGYGQFGLPAQFRDGICLYYLPAYQHTKRFHYTGIFPDDFGAIESHLSLPPYGQSVVWTANGGTQYNRKFKTVLEWH